MPGRVATGKLVTCGKELSPTPSGSWLGTPPVLHPSTSQWRGDGVRPHGSCWFRPHVTRHQGPACFAACRWQTRARPMEHADQGSALLLTYRMCTTARGLQMGSAARLLISLRYLPGLDVRRLDSTALALVLG